MSNRHYPAHPYPDQGDTGLTKREYAARTTH